MISVATITDIPEIYQAMRRFAQAAPIRSLSVAEPDARRCQHLIADLIHNHVALIARDQSGIFQGMLLAQIQSDLWLPEIKTLRELAWWVEPEYRGTSAGYKLLKTYKQIGQDLVQRGDIHQYTITLMTNSPPLDLASRGWREVETNYVGGIN